MANQNLINSHVKKWPDKRSTNIVLAEPWCLIAVTRKTQSPLCVWLWVGEKDSYIVKCWLLWPDESLFLRTFPQELYLHSFLRHLSYTWVKAFSWCYLYSYLLEYSIFLLHKISEGNIMLFYSTSELTLKIQVLHTK